MRLFALVRFFRQKRQTSQQYKISMTTKSYRWAKFQSVMNEEDKALQVIHAG